MMKKSAKWQKRLAIKVKGKVEEGQLYFKIKHKFKIIRINYNSKYRKTLQFKAHSVRIIQ